MDLLGLGGSLTVSWDVPARSGDQILVAVNAADGQDPATPDGYVVVGAFAAPDPGEVTTVYRKTATGGETSATVDFHQGLHLHTKTVLAAVYRGVDPNDPVDAVTATGTARGKKTVTVPSLTTTSDLDELVLIAGALNTLALNASWTAQGMTVRTSSSALLVASLLADQPLQQAGDTGPRTATVSAAGQLEGVLVALRPAASTFLFGHDQQGSTRLLTDLRGNVAATYSYSPYGQTTSHTGTVDTPLRYDGQYLDAETGCYYLQARYYDPEAGYGV